MLIYLEVGLGFARDAAKSIFVNAHDLSPSGKVPPLLGNAVTVGSAPTPGSSIQVLEAPAQSLPGLTISGT